MDDKLDLIFEEIKNRVFELIQTKNVDIDAIAFDMKTNREAFLNSFNKRSENIGYYFEALHLLENWEG